MGVSSKVNKLLSMGLDRRKADRLSLEDRLEWENKTITSAIKTYLRQLPEPLMSFRYHTAFIAAASASLFLFFSFFFYRRAPAVVDRRLFHRSVTLVGGKEEKRTEIQLGHWPFSLLLLLLFCRARTAAPAVQRRPRPGPPAARRPLPHARHPRGPPQKVLPPSCRCFVPIEFSFFFAKFHWPHLSLIGFYGEETSFNQFFLITGFWRH